MAGALVAAALALAAARPLAGADAAASAPGVVEEAVTWLGVRVDPARIVNQHLHPGDNACVPTTLLNALRLGPPEFRRIADALPGASDRERLDGIISGAGNLPSTVEAGQPCYSDSNGVRADDIPRMLDQLLAGTAAQACRPSGRYLDRLGDESLTAQIRRIHGLLLASLAAGMPVVTSLRSFHASRAEEGKEFLWNGLGGHTVLIVALPRELPPGGLGFGVRFVDPWTASVEEGYVRGEAIRGFKAVKGSGSKDFVWRENAFLQFDGPTLALGTARLPFFERSFITLNYGVGRFPDAPPP